MLKFCSTIRVRDEYYIHIWLCTPVTGAQGIKLKTLVIVIFIHFHSLFIHFYSFFFISLCLFSILNIEHFLQNFTPECWNVIDNLIKPVSIAVFFKNGLTDFWEKFHHIFKGNFFLHRISYPLGILDPYRVRP